MKKIAKLLVRLFFKIVPFGFLVKKYTNIKLSKSIFEDIFEQVYVERFFEKSLLVKNFDECCKKVESSNRYCLIQQGNWEYKVINFCFVKEMLSNIIWCIERGYKPLIDIKSSIGNYKEKSNLWEKMYIQPFGEDLEKIKNNPNVQLIICPLKAHCINPVMRDVRGSTRGSKKIEFWNKMFNKFVVYNDFCQKYVDDEFETLLKDKRCLGCLIRGTDYIKIRPKSHPIQPTLEELIEKAKQTMKEQKLDYIYLATEEKKAADALKNEFGDIIIENKRKYFDEVYEKENISRVSQVNFDREDDDFWKMLEYMSSINLLSKCDSIVAGLCGGSEAAIYFNGNKYRETYLFDKGYY
ncbi:MAG: hypothetical protein J6V36_04355 [Clostridia bacterium]|nr:hypothetical protein [Clostridia bacterium]